MKINSILLFFLLLLSFITTQADNLLQAIPQSSLPDGWQTAIRWKGKSQYTVYNGQMRIERHIGEDGAGAFFSPLLAVIPGQKYFFNIGTKTMNLQGVCQLAAIFRDAQNKEFGYTLLWQTKEDSRWSRQKTALIPPPNAVSVKFMLVLSGYGNVFFRNPYFSTNSELTLLPPKLLNGDFSQLEDDLPIDWSPALNWKGKSNYRAENNTAIITRTDSDNGSGAYLSTRFAIAPNTTYQFSARVKVKALIGSAKISIRYFNEQNKVVNYTELFQAAAKALDWQTKKILITPPANATSAILMLVISGTGEVHFSDIHYEEPVPETKPGAVNLLLNSSFEEADLNHEFIDCFQVVTGNVRRTDKASHGFHALELSNASLFYYGSEHPSLPTKTEKFYYHLDGAGDGTLELRFKFFDSDQKMIEEKKLPLRFTQTQYNDFNGTVEIPPKAQSASFAIAYYGQDSGRLDGLYLSDKPFLKQYLPDPVPIFPAPDIPDKQQTPPRSSVRDYQGTPTWFIEDTPIVNSIFTLTTLTPESRPSWIKYCQKVIKNGNYPIVLLNCYITPEEFGERYTQSSAFRDIDYQIRLVRALKPDTKFVIWLAQEPTIKFSQDFPNELLEVEEMQGNWRYGTTAPYSYGSEVWGKYCATGLKKFIYQLLAQDYGSNIVGIVPGLGRFGENNYAYSTMTQGWSAHDMGKAMTNFFRKWLFAEYHYDLNEFRKAWHQSFSFGFTDAQVPGVVRRTNKRKNNLENIMRRDVFDYSRCESVALLHRILEQVQIVKEISDGRLFTMAQIAYFSEGIFHRELDTALKNPYLDALGPAPPYINRGAGDDVIDHGPSAAVRQAGKIWFFQADIRSHLCPDYDRQYGSTKNLAESIAIYLRDIGHYMTTGAIPYYLSFTEWYDDTQLWSLIGKLDLWMQLSGKFPRQSRAEIAIVTNPLSIAAGYQYNYKTRLMTPYQSTIGYNRQLEWHHLGTPYDFYLLDNLLNAPNLKQYNLIVMADTMALTQEQRDLIKQRFYRDNRTIVWLYTPGIVNKIDDHLNYNVSNASIAGFNFHVDEEKRNLKLQLTSEALTILNMPPEHNIAGYFHTALYGWPTTPDKPLVLREECFSPRLTIQPDSDIEILGTYLDDGKIAAARKKQLDYTTIFWGSTALGVEVLRGIARSAGIHLYSENDAVVYANSNFLSIHVPEARNQKIQLPQKSEIIYDLYQERILANNSDSLTVSMPEKSSLLLYFGNKEQLQNAWQQIKNQFNNKNQKNLTEKKNYPFDPFKREPLARSIEMSGSYSPDASGFIRHWLFLGPFPDYEKQKAYQTDFLVTSGGETKIHPEANQRFKSVFHSETNKEHNAWFSGIPGVKELMLSWRPLMFSQGITAKMHAELPDLFTFNRMAYYLACYIENENPRKLQLFVSSDDGHKSYLNGKIITAIDTLNNGRSLTIDSEKGEVMLPKGKSLLLLKITQIGGGVGHAVRFFDPQNKQYFTDYIIKLQP